MSDGLKEVIGLSIAACATAYWINRFTRALLVGWIMKRDAQQRRADAIRVLLEGQHSKETIDWVIYGDRMPQNGLINTIATIAAKHVYTWDEWKEQDDKWEPPLT